MNVPDVVDPSTPTPFWVKYPVALVVFAVFAIPGVILIHELLHCSGRWLLHLLGFGGTTADCTIVFQYPFDGLNGTWLAWANPAGPWDHYWIVPVTFLLGLGMVWFFLDSLD